MSNVRKPRHVVFHAFGLFIVAGAVAASVSLSAAKKRAEASDVSAREAELREGPLVAVASVEKAPPKRTITLPAEVHAYRQATLYAKVSGYLKLVRVDKGERVRSGEVLGVIEAPEVEQQVLSKQADLAIKKLTDARYRMLARNGLVSQQEMERAQADVSIANADLLALQTIRGYQVIRAPFDGVVTARYADPGALLQAATGSQSALPLVDVAELSRVRVQVHLAQTEALFVKDGDPVDVWTDERPNARVHGTVTRRSQSIDAKTRTKLVEVDLENKDGVLFPGTIVRAQLAIDAPDSLRVPADALVVRGGTTSVARVTGGHATFVRVEVVDSDGARVRVHGELEPGATIVLHPGDDVVDGAAVRVAPPPAAAKHASL
jgi:RND family efflux transporter MFP subunit